MKLLERRRAHPAVVEEVKTKLDRLVGHSLREMRTQRESADSVPPAVVVRDIVVDMVDSVCQSKIPYLEMERAQRAAASQRQELYDLHRQLFETELRADLDVGDHSRAAKAHEAFMSTMFKEVLALRTTIRQLEDRNEALEDRLGTLRRVAPDAESVSPRGVSPTMSPLPTGEREVADRTVDRGATKAIFDYEAFIRDLNRSAEEWPERFRELEDNFAAYVKETNKNSAEMAASYQASMRRKDQQIAARDRQIKQLKDVVQTFYPRVMNALRTVQSDFEVHVEAIRRDANAQRAVMDEWFLKVQRHLAAIDLRFEVFVDFSVHAFTHLAKKVHHLARGKGPMPFAAPIWHFFLLQGAADPREEAKVFWQSHPHSQAIVHRCREITECFDAAQHDRDTFDAQLDDFDMSTSAHDADGKQHEDVRATTPSTAVALLKGPSVAKRTRASKQDDELQEVTGPHKRGQVASLSKTSSPAQVKGGASAQSAPSNQEDRGARPLATGAAHRGQATASDVAAGARNTTSRAVPSVGISMDDTGFVLGSAGERNTPTPRRPHAPATPSSQARPRREGRSPPPQAAPTQTTSPIAQTQPSPPTIESPVETPPTRDTAVNESPENDGGESVQKDPLKDPLRPTMPGVGTTAAEDSAADAGARKNHSASELQMAHATTTSTTTPASPKKQSVGSRATQTSLVAVDACMGKKERRLRERLVQGVDRASRGVTYGIWGRITLRAQRNAFFNRLSTAAKNAYMTLVFMDSELLRLNDSVAHMRARRVQLEEQVLALDRSVLDAAEAAKRKTTGEKGSTALAVDANRGPQSPSNRTGKSGTGLASPRRGTRKAEDDRGTGDGSASDNDGEAAAGEDDVSRLTNIVLHTSAAQAASLGGGTSMKASRWERFVEDTGTSAPGFQVRSHVPPQDVYIPSPGHVISTNVNERSRELLVRRGLIRHGDDAAEQ
eukprot:CAMPEP_0174867408 /NCGR_PEP_ID=MMETSP1114-20130205/63930_1 /TAXON_ID=312471 /ORGANISM="Neobodo designis, Strain CCAP 1951/1" /LENGTH=951 /DNA_ID=CAMNT_0016102599 /DNA_START=72 /DNA_END=2925 /DNA_ORIENTATION=+